MTSAESRRRPSTPGRTSTEVRARVELKLKQEATAILKAAGWDMSSAVRVFLRSVVKTGGLPTRTPRGNRITDAALCDAKSGKTTRTTLEDL